MIYNFIQNSFKFFSVICILCGIQGVSGQNLVNNGATIVVNNGAYVVISGNYLNNNDGAQDGQVSLDGNIILKRNWINNANNEVLINVGSGNTGNVIMNGSLIQSIGGNHSSIFENLILRGSDKILNVTDSKVNDTLTISAILDLNKNKIKILNPNPSGIKYLNGCIISETNSDEGLGEVEWYIGSNQKTYNLPFGSRYSNYNNLNFSLTTKTSGDPSDGSISFATYPTDCENLPFPSEVMALDRESQYILDRFWHIYPNYSTNPDVDMVFSYMQEDIAANCNPGLVETKLKAIRWNNILNTWSDFLPSGQVYPMDDKLELKNVSAGDFYAPWCLVSEITDYTIYIPNAFTPNGDNDNDVFGPVGYNLDNATLTMYIYDRWGKLIYTMEDINKPWNGTYENTKKPCELGIYTWVMFFKSPDGINHSSTGIVTLVR